MAQGSGAADSSIPVTSDMVDSARALFGAAPAFWGRYFTSASTTGDVEYRHAVESEVLGSAGIRLLPVCRQTTHVNGTNAQGLADGLANAGDFITTFGKDYLVAQGGTFYMFLDVEGQPSLEIDYYTGWVNGLAQKAQELTGGAVQVLPCVYAMQSDLATWDNLSKAIAAGTPCRGVWVARYYHDEPAVGEWLSDILCPKCSDTFGIPILAWQYCDKGLNGQIDCTQINPAIDAQNDLLQYLVLPAAQQA
jgi:hypothetical protein